MKVSKLRSLVGLFALALLFSTLSALPASAANLHLAFVAGRGPADAHAGERITSQRFNPDGSKVQVEVLNSGNVRVTNVPVTVTLSLGSDPSGGSATLTVAAVTTSQGLAEFSTLSINKANVAEFSAYTLVASSTSDPTIGTATSGGFDIWESVSDCSGGNCTLNHPTVNDPTPDTYRAPNSTGNDFITASTFLSPPEGDTAGPGESDLDCDGYEEMTGFVVYHEYSGNGAVFVVIHTARTEMKESASNGQSTVKLCVGLSRDWSAQQIAGEVDQPVQKDTDGNGTPDLWVGLAPLCPKKNPQSGSPCFTRRYGDGNGGNFLEAWLPGGDPPRRT